MGGLLTHLSVAVFGLVIGVFAFESWKYGVAFFFGQLVPDLIDFGTLGLFHLEFNPAVIMTYDLFPFLVWVGHTLSHWIIFGVLVFGILFWLKKKNKLSKEKFKFWIVTEVFFLVGVFVHLIIDKLVIETSYWI